MRFEVHSFYIHNRETLTPIHPHPTLTHLPGPPLLLHLLPLPGRRVHRSARFRGHSPLRFFVQPSFQASQAALSSPHSLHSLGECRTLARNRYTLHLAFPTMCPYRAIDQDTPLLPAGECTVLHGFGGTLPYGFSCNLPS